MTDNFLRNYWAGRAGRAGRAGVAAVLVVAAGLDQLGGQERLRLLPCWHSTGGSGRPQTSLTSTSPRPRSLLRPSRHMEEEEDKIDLGKTSPHHNLAYKSEQFLQHSNTTIKLTQQLINIEYILFKGVVVTFSVVTLFFRFRQHEWPCLYHFPAGSDCSHHPHSARQCPHQLQCYH